jgi:hypothetical protein
MLIRWDGRLDRLFYIAAVRDLPTVTAKICNAQSRYVFRFLIEYDIRISHQS